MAEELSESEALEILSAATRQIAGAQPDESGACVYSAGTKTYCAVVSRDVCNGLKGIFTPGGRCP